VKGKRKVKLVRKGEGTKLKKKGKKVAWKQRSCAVTRGRKVEKDRSKGGSRKRGKSLPIERKEGGKLVMRVKEGSARSQCENRETDSTAMDQGETDHKKNVGGRGEFTCRRQGESTRKTISS